MISVDKLPVVESPPDRVEEAVPSAIIIGASSGIGRELARLLSAEGYRLGLVARRETLLEELGEDLPGPTYIKALDLSRPESAMVGLRELIAEMGEVDLFIISAGTGFPNKTLAWEPEWETIAVNVVGFAAVANVAVEHLETRGTGHIVGISSVSAVRGSGVAPAYSASKAFVSNYLHGLRCRFSKRRLGIAVTDIQPGFVDTGLAKGDKLFWVASTETAARQIYRAIQKRKAHAYVTRRWRLVAWLMKILPDWLYFRI